MSSFINSTLAHREGNLATLRFDKSGRVKLVSLGPTDGGRFTGRSHIVEMTTLSLLDSLEHQKNQQFLNVFATFFSDERIKQEGIFRTPGSFAKIEDLTKKIGASFNSDISDLINDESINTVASLFKKFIKECELLPSDTGCQESLLEADKMKEPMKLDFFQTAIYELPISKRKLLREILAIFKKVVRFSEDNKMDLKALATCIGPCLFPFNKEAVSAPTIAKVELQNSVTEYMIRRQDVLFIDIV